MTSFRFLRDIQRKNYSEKDLQKLDEKNIEYNGKLYNQYEISQIQRRYEREIRSAKREQVAFEVAVEEADDPELLQVMQDSLNYANSLVRDRQKKMRDFIRQTGQNRDYFREQNYPKENIRKDLTFFTNSSNIEESIAQQDYMKKVPCEKACANNGEFKIYHLREYENVWSQTYSKDARKTAEYITSKLSTGIYGDLDRIIIAKNKKLGGIAAYNYQENAFAKL